MKRALNPATVPTSPFYAQGIEVTGVSRTVFVSGQVGIDPEGRTAEGIAGQARQAVANLNAVLAEAGLAPDAIAKLTIYLTDPEHIGPFAEAAGPTLPADPPATPLLIVQARRARTTQADTSWVKGPLGRSARHWSRSSAWPSASRSRA
jgi:enamine deaminase RidA (YjgF/YER057c/UK114 family)